MVDKPAEVRVDQRVYRNEFGAGDGITLTIFCHDDDRGKVIGRRGATIGHLRALFTAIGAADGRKVTIRVSER